MRKSLLKISIFKIISKFIDEINKQKEKKNWTSVNWWFNKKYVYSFFKMGVFITYYNVVDDNNLDWL